MLRVFATPTIRLTVERIESEEMLDKVQCSAANCTFPSYVKTLCSAHYKRLLRFGFIGSAPVRGYKKPNEVRLCEIEGCSNLYLSSGMCKVHYSREARKNQKEYLTRQTLLDEERNKKIFLAIESISHISN
jgi:hypothetical protein